MSCEPQAIMESPEGSQERSPKGLTAYRVDFKLGNEPAFDRFAKSAAQT